MGADGKKTILVVDDDEIQLAITRNILQDSHDILTAKSGTEAIKYFLKGSFPDLVLLDIMMPEMDGWETYRKLKALSLLRDIPIVFCTAVLDKSSERQAYELGAADYITKPIDPDELLNRIRLVFSGKNRK